MVASLGRAGEMLVAALRLALHTEVKFYSSKETILELTDMIFDVVRWGPCLRL
jgi:hypothetical protein